MWDTALLVAAVWCGYLWGRGVEKERWRERFQMAGGTLTLTEEESDR